MLFEFGFRSAVLLIFFTHIMVSAIMVLRRGFLQDLLSDKLLGFFLLSGALFIAPWMLGFAGWFDHQPYRTILFYMPFVHALVMGPLLYLYIISITNYTYRLRRKDWVHFIPEALYCLWRLVSFVGDKLVLGHPFFVSNKTDPDFNEGYSYLWLLSLISYLWASLRYYRQYKRFIDFEVSFTDRVNLGWIKNILYSFILLTIVTIVLKVLSLFWDLEYWTSWYFFLCFGLIVYYLAIHGYKYQAYAARKIKFDPILLLDYEPRPPAPVQETTETPGDVPSGDQGYDPVADNAGLEEWADKLTQLMITEKAYLDPEITLSELSKRLKTNTSVLSRVINQFFEKGFNDYINGYRVEDVKRRMEDKSYRNQTLLSMGYDAGFNSKSTFNRAFKKAVGISPKEYMDRIVGPNS
jgi:AraC-like DNA-binding protein